MDTLNNNQNRYFIYVRKSTGGEKRQARSIGDQLAEIRELIRKENLEIVGSFEESQSAMTKGRPLFNEMLDRIEAGEANGIIAWHPDRLARNAFDGGRIIDLIDRHLISDLRFCSFWFEATAQGKLMLNLAFGQSKYYSDSLSVNIRRGQRQKVNAGIWSWKAPVGYLNDPQSRTIVIDPVKGPLIRLTFELYASGHHTIFGLRDTMYAKGLRSHFSNRITLSGFQRILKNPFYFGLFNLNGELHEGAHDPLITKAIYDKVQEVMTRRSKPNTVRLKSYVYRGLFHCGECGCVVTMETQKGHNYLRCTKRIKRNCTQAYLREENMTEPISHALKSVSLPDDVADWMLASLANDRNSSRQLIRESERQIKKEIETIDAKLDRLTAAYLDAGAFTAMEFRRRKAELLGNKRHLLDSIEALARSDESRFEPPIRFVNGSKQMKYVVLKANPKELRSKLEHIGSNLTMFNKKLNWQPRGPWQLIVDAGRLAQKNAATFTAAARLFGETDQTFNKWSQRDANRTFHSWRASSVR